LILRHWSYQDNRVHTSNCDASPWRKGEKWVGGWQNLLLTHERELTMTSRLLLKNIRLKSLVSLLGYVTKNLPCLHQIGPTVSFARHPTAQHVMCAHVPHMTGVRYYIEPEHKLITWCSICRTRSGGQQDTFANTHLYKAERVIFRRRVRRLWTLSFTIAVKAQ
jgi:hypothetical protein